MTWDLVLKEAQVMLDNDSFMEDVLRPFILDHKTYGGAITTLLAAEFEGFISASKWKLLFETAYIEQIYDVNERLNIETMGMLDLFAVRDRDAATDGLVNPFLHFKGFKAIQAHRIAHILWKLNRKDTARCIQSRCSEMYGIDIHPAALIGPGLFLDHGTGVVIGETAVVGSNCTFLHGVTLGKSKIFFSFFRSLLILFLSIYFYFCSSKAQLVKKVVIAILRLDMMFSLGVMPRSWATSLSVTVVRSVRDLSF